VIYGQVLPGLDVTSLQLFLGLALLVVVNTAVAVCVARSRVGTDSALLTFVLRVGLDVTIVVVAHALLGDERMDVPAAMFFVAMLCLGTLLHDRYLPVHAARATISARSATSSTSKPAPAPGPVTRRRPASRH
jgi:hypothetical protein